MIVELINYFDVWGNEIDGYEINDQCIEFTKEFTEEFTEDNIFKFLMKEEFYQAHTIKDLLYFDLNYDDGCQISEIQTNGSNKPSCFIRILD